jgi:hypothetical protein
MVQLSKLCPVRKLMVIAFSLIAVIGFSQKKIVWFDVGLKGQMGGSALYNKAIFDAATVNYELGLSNSYSIGGKIGVNFEYTGLSIDAMYNRGANTILTPSSSSQKIIQNNWTSFDIYPLLRSAKNLGYFEIGPKISFLQTMEQDRGSGASDIINEYNKLNYSAVLGFGANIIGSDGRFSGILGIRLEYGVNDIVNSGLGKINSAPSNLGSIYDAGYKSSHPVFAGLVFEANWGVGYFGRAKCGARSKFIMF